MARTIPALGSGLLLGLALATPALADVIDGNWCSERSGKSMQIDGPAIVTPGGTRTEGHYSRHSFSYVVPERDEGAGSVVRMRLLDENDVQVQTGETGDQEIWKRCEHTS